MISIGFQISEAQSRAAAKLSGELLKDIGSQASNRTLGSLLGKVASGAFRKAFKAGGILGTALAFNEARGIARDIFADYQTEAIRLDSKFRKMAEVLFPTKEVIDLTRADFEIIKGTIAGERERERESLATQFHTAQTAEAWYWLAVLGNSSFKGEMVFTTPSEIGEPLRVLPTTPAEEPKPDEASPEEDQPIIINPDDKRFKPFSDLLRASGEDDGEGGDKVESVDTEAPENTDPATPETKKTLTTSQREALAFLEESYPTTEGEEEDIAVRIVKKIIAITDSDSSLAYYSVLVFTKRFDSETWGSDLLSALSSDRDSVISILAALLQQNSNKASLILPYIPHFIDLLAYLHANDIRLNINPSSEMTYEIDRLFLSTFPTTPLEQLSIIANSEAISGDEIKRKAINLFFILARSQLEGKTDKDGNLLSDHFSKIVTSKKIIPLAEHVREALSKAGIPEKYLLLNSCQASVNEIVIDWDEEEDTEEDADLD